jgi:hypothetical protein
MTQQLDMTDVPVVPAAELALAMQFMIDNGKGLVLLRGLTASDMRTLEAAVWDRLEGSVAQRRAVLVRFQCLADVFGARRLNALMLRSGFPLISLALKAAATMRLNVKWGFSPTKFNTALQWALTEAKLPRPRPVEADLDLAA